MNFNDLVNRSQIVSEGKPSPYGVKNPVFMDITKRLKTAGASSPPWDTMQVIINVLQRLKIISKEEEANWISSQGFSLKKNALLGFIDLYKEDIISRAEEVKETIEDELPNFFRRAGTNRGAAKGPSRGETKYAANAAAEEMKAQDRKQKNEAKKLAKELRQQAKGKGKGKGPRAAAAVEVIATGLDDYVARGYAAGEEVILKAHAAEVFGEIGKNLGKEGLDIDLKNLTSAANFVADKISTLDQLKRFVDQVGRKPGFELIAQYLADIIKPVEDVISASKSKDGINSPGKEGLAAARGFEKKGVTESTTAEYLTEQIKKDRYNKASNEASLSFTEKFKPKTSWQLQELRNYGL